MQTRPAIQKSNWQTVQYICNGPILIPETARGNSMRQPTWGNLQHITLSAYHCFDLIILNGFICEELFAGRSNQHQLYLNIPSISHVSDGNMFSRRQINSHTGGSHSKRIIRSFAYEVWSHFRRLLRNHLSWKLWINIIYDIFSPSDSKSYELFAPISPVRADR